MYKELVERLRKMYTFCAWDELKDAANVIETLLSENIELKRSITFLNKNTLGKLRAELDRLRHERDQAIKDLRHNDACEVCIGFNDQEDCDCECLDCKLKCRCKNCIDESLWQWRGVQEENNATG